MKRLLLWLLVFIIAMMFATGVYAAGTGDPPAAPQIDLTDIIQSVLALLAAFVTYKVLPWIKERTTAQHQALINGTIRTLVFAAEQLYGAGRGKEKLAYVKGKLRTKGFDVDVDAIEAAVYEMGLPQIMVGEELTAEIVAPDEG